MSSGSSGRISSHALKHFCASTHTDIERLNLCRYCATIATFEADHSHRSSACKDVEACPIDCSIKRPFEARVETEMAFDRGAVWINLCYKCATRIKCVESVETRSVRCPAKGNLPCDRGMDLFDHPPGRGNCEESDAKACISDQ